MAVITDDQMEEALNFLASSDERTAELKADMERNELKAKRIKAAVYEVTGGTVGDRNAAAERSPEYQAALEPYFAALLQYNKLLNQRSTRVIMIDVWRSQESSRRTGHV